MDTVTVDELRTLFNETKQALDACGGDYSTIDELDSDVPSSSTDQSQYQARLANALNEVLDAKVTGALSRDIDAFEEAARRVEEHPEIYDAPLAQDYSPVHNPAAVPMPRSFDPDRDPLPIPSLPWSDGDEDDTKAFIDSLHHVLEQRVSERNIATDLRRRPLRFALALAAASIIVRVKAAVRWLRSAFRRNPGASSTWV
jgi:hypothetical protein